MAKTEYEIAEILAALCISALKCGQLEVAQKYLLDGYVLVLLLLK